MDEEVIDDEEDEDDDLEGEEEEDGVDDEVRLSLVCPLSGDPGVPGASLGADLRSLQPRPWGCEELLENQQLLLPP